LLFKRLHPMSAGHRPTLARNAAGTPWTFTAPHTPRRRRRGWAPPGQRSPGQDESARGDCPNCQGQSQGQHPLLEVMRGGIRSRAGWPVGWSGWMENVPAKRWGKPESSGGTGRAHRPVSRTSPVTCLSQSWGTLGLSWLCAGRTPGSAAATAPGAPQLGRDARRGAGPGGVKVNTKLTLGLSVERAYFVSADAADHRVGWS
jgi:hypothetical protein